MLLHRAFDLYGVNFWGFVNRVPKFSRHYDFPIYELSGGYTSPVRCREDLVRHGYLRAED